MVIFYGLAESKKELSKQYPDKIMNMKEVSKANEIEKELDNIQTEGFFSSIRKWNKNRKICKSHKTKLFYVGVLGENEVLKITRTL